MLRVLFVLVALPAVFAYAVLAKPPGSTTPSNEFRFVGFTDDATNALADTIDGGQGMLAMHALCQDDFGENARMCTSEEFWLSRNAEAPSTDAAWVHVPFGQSLSDFSGVPTNDNCFGWSRTPAWGSTIRPNGQLGVAEVDIQCVTARPVTCCTLIQ